MNKAVSANVQLQVDSANQRLRITYDEGGTQTIDIAIADNVALTPTTIGFAKSGDANAAVTIAITPGTHQVRIEATGYAHAL